MRMRELVRESGVPRTAIHHYRREGLLPPATKTAPNAALYGQEHVDRLKLIQAWRGDELGPLTIEQIRRAIDMVERGVEPDVAARMSSLPGATAEASSKGRKARLTLSDVAHEAGLSRSVTRSLHEAGLLVGVREPDGPTTFDEGDVAAAGVMRDVLAHEGVQPSDLEPIGELVSELARYEGALARLAAAQLPPVEAAARRRSLYRGLQALHLYLFRRLPREPSSGG